MDPRCGISEQDKALSSLHVRRQLRTSVLAFSANSPTQVQAGKRRVKNSQSCVSCTQEHVRTRQVRRDPTHVRTANDEHLIPPPYRTPNTSCSCTTSRCIRKRHETECKRGTKKRNVPARRPARAPPCTADSRPRGRTPRALSCAPRLARRPVGGRTRVSDLSALK